MSRAEKILKIQRKTHRMSEDELKQCLDFIKEIEKSEGTYLSEAHLTNLEKIFKEDAHLLKRL